MWTGYLKDVHRFVTVARAGSIQAAARELNISQPSLSKTIRNIESIFGSRLLDRTKKGVALTRTGNILFDSSVAILNEGDLARERIRDLVEGRSGLLRISAGTAWGYCYLPAIIQRLQSSYPDLKIELDIEITAQGLVRLNAGEVDFVVGGLEEGEAAHASLVREEIMTIQFAAACRVDHPLASKRQVSAADIAAMPLVIYQDDQHLLSKVLSQLDAESPGELNIAVKTRSLLVAMELVATGNYVTCLARPFLEKLAPEDVRILHVRNPLMSFRSGVYYRESLSHTEPLRELLRSVRMVGQPG